MRTRRYVSSALGVLLLVLSSAVFGKGYYVSVDALNPAYVRALIDAGLLNAPHGFKWVVENADGYKAWPAEITLTAPSHLSTITCSPPSKHGVVANAFLKDGVKVSGFATTPSTETFFEAAKRQGLKVSSVAYVGIDGNGPRRSADYGVSYPDAQFVAPNKTINLEFANQRETTKVETLHLILNPKTSESRDVVLQVRTLENSSLEITIDEDDNNENGYLAQTKVEVEGLSKPVPLYFIEKDSSSALVGFKRRVDLTFKNTPNKVVVYVGGSSYNNAHPASLRELLDKKNIVWPSEFSFADEPSLHVEQTGYYNTFLAEAAEVIQENEDTDADFFYQSVVDSTAHSYEGLLPRPFDPKNTDPITLAYIKAYQIVDQNLSKFLARAKADDVVFVLGDHGMEPITKMVNVARAVDNNVDAVPLRDVKLMASGTLILLYPLSNSQGDVDRAERYGWQLQKALRNLQFEGKPVLGQWYFKNGYKRPWPFHDAVWAFTGAEKFWLVSRENEQEIFLRPDATGMHGHSTNVPSMATGAFLKYPGANLTSDKPYMTAEISLLDVIPTFSSLMKISPPKNCTGRSLVD
ncbi:MAG: alkaline phosphatase family protein [Oligoflexales bacterium]